VSEFLEKPTEPVPGDVNAGTYVLERSALDGWEPGRPASIERDIFPALIAEGRPVYGFVSTAYWIDLGTPEKYLQAHFDILEGRVAFEPAYPSPYVAEGAEVDLRAHLGRWVVVGAGARVGAEATIEDSVLHRGAVVEGGANVVGSILGPGARVGERAVLEGSVLAEGASVPAGASLSGARISAGRRTDPATLTGPPQPLG
jgi:mannose-1-phosphate guanylyltransferase